MDTGMSPGGILRRCVRSRTRKWRGERRYLLDRRGKKTKTNVVSESDVKWIHTINQHVVSPFLFLSASELRWFWHVPWANTYRHASRQRYMNCSRHSTRAKFTNQANSPDRKTFRAVRCVTRREFISFIFAGATIDFFGNSRRPMRLSHMWHSYFPDVIGYRVQLSNRSSTILSRRAPADKPNLFRW